MPLPCYGNPHTAKKGAVGMPMNQLLLQVVIVVTFAALCFGGGYLTAFIVTRNQWRDEMIKRGFVLVDRRIGSVLVVKDNAGATT